MNTSSSHPLTIELQRCAKTFPDGTRVLEPLDLVIKPGETLVLLGPSGCGKTTTLRLIAGLEQPDNGGKVLFDGKDVTASRIENRHVGMVFQSYALFPNMTVAENIGYGLRIRKVPQAEQRTRISEMLSMMQLSHLSNRMIEQLSGGQKQRVALARALAVRPRALLLDEPLTALDAQLRESLRVDINMLLRELNITSVYVTHDQTEAMSLGDRIVVMSHGKIAQIGTPREIYHHPHNDFVANFVGTMNRIKGNMNNDGLLFQAGMIPVRTKNLNATEIMFRPEDIQVVDENNQCSHFSGTVMASFFLGDHTRLLVDIGQGQPIAVDRFARCQLKSGDCVQLSVNPAGLIVM